MVYHVLVPLTTPVAYITSVGFRDPFGRGKDPNEPFSWNTIYSFQYYESSNPQSWGTVANTRNIPNIEKLPSPSAILVSMGPDKALSQGEWAFAPHTGTLNGLTPPRSYIYDPTNGTISDGDIVRGIGALNGGPKK